MLIETDDRPSTLSRVRKYAKIAESAYKAGKYGYDVYKKYKKRRGNNYRAPRVRRRTNYMDARSGRVAFPKKRGSYRRKKKRSLKGRVNILEKKVGEDNDVVTNRAQIEGQLSVNDLECAYSSWFVGYSTNRTGIQTSIEGKQSDAGVTAQVAYDPSVLSQKVGLKVSQQIELKNNHTIPIQLTAYYYDCVNDTNDTPTTITEDVMESYGVTGWATNLMWNMNCPYESNLKNRWRKTKTQKFLMSAGDTIYLSQASPYASANNEVWVDRENTYWKGISKCIVVRLQGVVAHDKTTTTDVGWSAGKLDYIEKLQIKIDCEGTGVKLLTQGAGADALTTPVVTGPNVVEIEETS